MSQDNKGKPFFDRADQIAETGNWDYAIEMYLQGIAREPEELERGHHKLREVALQRKAAGGGGAGFFDKMKRKATKDPAESLVNAEWLMSRDPGNAPFWRQIVTAAKQGQWTEVARWAGGVLYDVNCLAAKPSKEAYLFLTQVYADMDLYSEAVRACQAAIQLDPDSPQLADLLRDLSAQDTIQKGKYDQEGDFTKAVKDLKGQLETVQKEQISHSHEFLDSQLEKARAAYEADPTVAGKIDALVDALVQLDEEAHENEAIGVLTKAHADSDIYRYKMRIGDITMRQLKRRYLEYTKVNDKAEASRIAKELLAFELQEYTERAANYPTDLGIKYELGKRQFIAGDYDEAIATLQRARRDPRLRTQATNALGLAFFKKGWHSEAAETFEQALEDDLGEKRRIELTYNLGQTYEAMNEFRKALDTYSNVAQIDFNYKDVRARIERLRNRDGHDEAGDDSDRPAE